jgi:hypothetical protein
MPIAIHLVSVTHATVETSWNPTVSKLAITQLPDYIHQLDQEIREEQNCAEPSTEETDEYILQLAEFSEGCVEAEVQYFFKTTMFPTIGLKSRMFRDLASSSSAPIFRYLLPDNAGKKAKMSQPKPDVLYGYSTTKRHGTFTMQQLDAQAMLRQNIIYPEATAQGLRFPFCH